MDIEPERIAMPVVLSQAAAALTGRQATDMNALSAAFHIVYGVLIPEQQHKADALSRNEARQHAAKGKRQS
jgi:hypothetical protein